MKKVLILGVIVILLCGCDKKLKIESEQVQNLYKMVNPSEDATVLDYLYKYPGHFMNPYIVSVAIKNHLNNSGETINSISKDVVQENVYKIFGKNINFSHKRAYILADGYCGFDYDKSLSQYKSMNGCDGDSNYKYYRKIIEARKEKKKIIIIEKSIYVYNTADKNYSYVTIYNNAIDKKIIKRFKGESNSKVKINIDDYLNEATTYQYVFQKEGKSYIFKEFRKL